jgi:hypothetical protein
MPIEARVRSEENLTRLIARDGISVGEIRAAIESFWEAPEITRDVLWDFRSASLREIGTEDLRRLVMVGMKYQHRFAEREGGKTAIVASENLEYGLMRASENLSEMYDYSFEIRTFRALGEAEEWLALRAELP